MALRQDITTDYGVTVPACYCRVESITFGAKDAAVASVDCFNESPEANPVAVKRFVFPFSYEMNSNKNIFEQAYLHIKSLPEWVGAVDC